MCVSVSFSVVSDSLQPCSLPGSSVHGILQERILEWVAMSSSRDLPDSGIELTSPVSPSLLVDSLPTEPLGKSFSWLYQRVMYLPGLGNFCGLLINWEAGFSLGHRILCYEVTGPCESNIVIWQMRSVCFRYRQSWVESQFRDDLTVRNWKVYLSPLSPGFLTLS